MVKSSLLDWDTSAAGNTDVGGINIAEGCAAANLNNGLREVMAQIKSGVDYKSVVSAKGANYTAVLNDNNAVIRFTGAYTLSLTAAATLGDGWHVKVHAYAGDVVIDPDGSETVNGATTATIKSGSAALVYCTGTAFFATIIDLSTKADKANPFVDVASAATVDLGAASSFAVNITGNTGPITSFGTSAADGTEWLLKFASDPTISPGASLITPEGTNIVAFAGMTMRLRKEPSNVWRVLSYTDRSYVTGGGSYRVAFDASALTATRTSTFPDRAVNFGNVPVLSAVKSSQLTATLGGLLEFTHGLGAQPEAGRLYASIVNTSGSTNLGYADGIELRLNFSDSIGSAAGYGIQVWADATKIYGRVGNTGLASILNGSTGSGGNVPTVANWKVYLGVAE